MTVLKDSKKKEMKDKVDDLILRMKTLYIELRNEDDGSIEYADMIDVITNGIGVPIYAD